MNFKPIICESCKAKNEQDASFCIYCGMSLSKEKGIKQLSAEPKNCARKPRIGLGSSGVLLMILGLTDIFGWCTWDKQWIAFFERVLDVIKIGFYFVLFGRLIAGSFLFLIGIYLIRYNGKWKNFFCTISILMIGIWLILNDFLVTQNLFFENGIDAESVFREMNSGWVFLGFAHIILAPIVGFHLYKNGNHSR
ncbi:MAG: hypothetical protein R2824_29660 [Saprospiraceae bacterium]